MEPEKNELMIEDVVKATEDVYGEKYSIDPQLILNSLLEKLPDEQSSIDLSSIGFEMDENNNSTATSNYIVFLVTIVVNLVDALASLKR